MYKAKIEKWAEASEECHCQAARAKRLKKVEIFDEYNRTDKLCWRLKGTAHSKNENLYYIARSKKLNALVQ